MPGFSTTKVKHYLGDPAAIGYGDYAGFTYYYGAGSGSPVPVEMEILFAEDDADRAVRITVNRPHPGKTKEGVGLGSPRQIVRWFLGAPDAGSIRTSWMRLGEGYFEGDTYLGGDSTAMIFHYDPGEHVDRISFVRSKIE